MTLKNLSLCLGLAFCTMPMYAQFAPEDTTAFINVRLRNVNESPYVGKFLIKGKRGYKGEFATDKNGKVRAVVPYNDEYTFQCGEYVAKQTVKIEKMPYVTYEYDGFSKTCVIINFTYRLPNGTPVPDEVITITNAAETKSFQKNTDSMGRAKFVLPLDDYYTGVALWEKYNKLEYDRKSKAARFIYNVEFKGDGLAEKARKDSVEYANFRAKWIADSIQIEKNVQQSYAEHRKKVEAAYNKARQEKNPYLMIIDWQVEADTTLQRKIKEKANLLAPEYFYQTPPEDGTDASKLRFLECGLLNVLEGFYDAKEFQNPIIVAPMMYANLTIIEELALWHQITKSPINQMVFYGANTTASGFFVPTSFEHLIKIVKSKLPNITDGGLHGSYGADMLLINATESSVALKPAVMEAIRKRKNNEPIIVVLPDYTEIKDAAEIEKLNVKIEYVLPNPRTFALSCGGGIMNSIMQLILNTKNTLHTLYYKLNFAYFMDNKNTSRSADGTYEFQFYWYVYKYKKGVVTREFYVCPRVREAEAKAKK